MALFAAVQCFPLREYAGIRAQTLEPTDSVYVTGTVSNFNDWRPMTGCTVQLEQDGDTVATTISTADGSFAFAPLPAGRYTLRVSREFSFYRADFVLASSADLNIAVDTVRRMQLRPVEVKQTRRSTNTLLITSYNDIRLWNLSGEMGLPRTADVGDLNSRNPFIRYGSRAMTFWKNYD